MKNLKVNKNYFLAIFALVIPQLVEGGCRNGRIIKSGITAEERRLILEEHNFLRQTVAMGHVRGQPAAQNMQEIKWDDELALRAQMWANECTFAHDPSRFLDRFIMGQNVGLLWSTTPLADNDGDFPSRVRNWFNEVQIYAWGAKWTVNTGHYSQLVWGETNLVGCGYSYSQETTGRRLYNKIYVCNYGPGGNVVGAKPYKTGMPKCRNFGMSDSPRYPGLCKQYDDNEVEHNVAGSEYVDLEFNSINVRGGNAGVVPSHFTYKTHNGELENHKRKNNAIIVPSPTSLSPTYVNHRNYNRISNNEVHSFAKRHQQSSQSSRSQQQYVSNRQQVHQYQQQPNYQQNQQMTPFLEAFHQAHQQHAQKRPVVDKTNPFQTYRWDQLFKNNNHV